MGESKFERKNRRFVAVLCGGIILVLVIAGIVWWWRTGDDVMQ